MSEIIWMALGAVLMYFFDPASGRERRAWLRNKWDRWGNQGTPVAPTTATAPRYTAAEQSVAEPTPADRAAALPTDEALGGRGQGGEIVDEPGDPVHRYKHE
ncbi:MAG: hypothetical protein ACREXS_08345 [Gammaproteobacteria bacterium]